MKSKNGTKINSVDPNQMTCSKSEVGEPIGHSWFNCVITKFVFEHIYYGDNLHEMSNLFSEKKKKKKKTRKILSIVCLLNSPDTGKG